jgi:hypothetical protein
MRATAHALANGPANKNDRARENARTSGALLSGSRSLHGALRRHAGVNGDRALVAQAHLPEQERTMYRCLCFYRQNSREILTPLRQVHSMGSFGSERDRALLAARKDGSFRAVSGRLECAHCFLPNAVLRERIDIWPDNWAASPRIAGARFSLSPNSSEGIAAKSRT